MWGLHWNLCVTCGKWWQDVSTTMHLRTCWDCTLPVGRAWTPAELLLNTKQWEKIRGYYDGAV